MKKLIYLIVCSCGLLLQSCDHQDHFSPFGDMIVTFDHNIDEQSLHWDTLMYQNDANETFSINKLQYYISNIRLYRAHTLQHTIDTVIYIDAKQQAQLQIQKIPLGNYDSMALFIGVDPLHNVHDMLPATQENTAMEWPDMMGGGYHFLKLEGHWKNNAQQPGFAIHLGTNPYIVDAGAKCNIQISPMQTHYCKLNMNISEWLKNPYQYSFSSDGVYTMGNAVLMQKIAANGKDVFSIINQ